MWGSATEGRDKQNNKKNHYDDYSSEDDDEQGRHRKKKHNIAAAQHDLEAEPHEGVGIFVGLEVLDGSQYTVVKNKKGGSVLQLLHSDGDDKDPEEDHEVVGG